MAASRPITCVAIMATASGITGFTLPGMMLLPGCSAGSVQLRQSGERAASPSSAGRWRSSSAPTASVRSWPEYSTAASWLRLRREEVGGGRERHRRSAPRSSSMKRAANSACALMPVPMAVPPCASASRRGSLARSRSMASSICARQPDTSWPERQRHGIHQVRAPGLEDLRPRRVPCRAAHRPVSRSAGSKSRRMASTALTWIALGITSLLLWHMLT